MKKGESCDSPFFYTPCVTRRKKVLKLKLLGVLAVFVCLLSGCNRRELQDGFVLIRTSSDSHTLAKPSRSDQPYNESLIYPNVVKVKDNEQFIVGLREVKDLGGGVLDRREDQPYGYFIYDKTTEELIMGLSEDELAELNEERGIELRLE